MSANVWHSGTLIREARLRVCAIMPVAWELPQRNHHHGQTCGSLTPSLQPALLPAGTRQRWRRWRRTQAPSTCSTPQTTPSTRSTRRCACCTGARRVCMDAVHAVSPAQPTFAVSVVPAATPSTQRCTPPHLGIPQGQAAALQGQEGLHGCAARPPRLCTPGPRGRSAAAGTPGVCALHAFPTRPILCAHPCTQRVVGCWMSAPGAYLNRNQGGLERPSSVPCMSIRCLHLSGSPSVQA